MELTVTVRVNEKPTTRVVAQAAEKMSRRLMVMEPSLMELARPSRRRGRTLVLNTLTQR